MKSDAEFGGLSSRNIRCSLTFGGFLSHWHCEETDFGQSSIIAVIGKAMWDVGHAPKEQNTRQKYMPDYAVWEIHPVMKLDVKSD